jgi:hypothetical protein
MTEIIGIFGLQGWGKTALTTYMGRLAYEQGFDIYSNYPLGFEHTLITSLKEAKEIRNGYFLLDEFWEWAHARTSQSKINKEMMEICLLNRKRGISLIYNTQLKRTIDVILRDVTNYRYLPHMVKHEDDKYYIHYVMRDLLDRESDEMMVTIPIDEIGKWFSTNYEVKKLMKNNEDTPLQKGIKLEEDFVKAVGKCKGVYYVELIPNSGNGSSWSYDVIVYAGNGVYAVDVKGATSRVFLTEFGNDLIKKIDNAYQHHALSYLAFPNTDYKQLSLSKAWYMYKLTKNCYIKRFSAPPRYNKLKNNSMLLSNFQFQRGKTS